MDAALALHRFQFAFTITFHYLFPQLTMGLALLLVIWKAQEWCTGDPHYGRVARFWGRVFAVNFAFGVVTGIPLEFQFGTNWARFSAATGGVIGQLLAMEGVFSFFLESSFLGLFLLGEQKVGRRGHAAATVLVALGSWLSGLFIVAVNAWMQHPVGHAVGAAGDVRLESLTALFTNPWLVWQYAHTMLAAVVTASFVVAAVGAYYLLGGVHLAPARTFVRTGVTCGLVASLLVAFPTGDGQSKNVARQQPITFAAMEGVFHDESPAGMVLIGQPDVDRLRLDNPIAIPGVLSFLTHKRWSAEIRGLDSFPRDQWPDNIPLLYFGYHIMAGLGTMFIALMGISAFLLRRGRLLSARPLLWALMLAAPFPYIANTAGWITAELGRQPWLVHGLIRTAQGSSLNVHSGNVLFTLLGFLGLYTVLAILFLFLAGREIAHGPEPELAPAVPDGAGPRVSGAPAR